MRKRQIYLPLLALLVVVAVLSATGGNGQVISFVLSG